MLPRQNMDPANDWISLQQALDKRGALVRRNSIHLPTELKMKILESLPGVDIARASCVCSDFLNLASDINDLWKQKCLEEYAGFVIEEAEELIYDLAVDWKTKFVEYWRRNNRKEGISARRVVSCNPFRDGGFSGATDWDRGSGSSDISVRSLL